MPTLSSFLCSNAERQLRTSATDALRSPAQSRALHILKTDDTSIEQALGLHRTQLFTAVRNLWGRLLSSFHNPDPDLAYYHRH